MKYPIMNGVAANLINLPNFQGGINAEDAVNAINDNQLCDAENLWIYNGKLQTRPKVKQLATKAIRGEVDYSKMRWCDSIVDGVKTRFIFVNAVDDTLANCVYAIILNSDSDEFNAINIMPYSADESEEAEYICFCGTSTVENGLGVYLICNVKKDGSPTRRMMYEITGEKNDDGVYEYNNVQIKPTDIYKPTVYYNGKGEGYNRLPINEETATSPASYFEGFNMLGGGFKAYFYSDGISVKFKLPFSLTDGDDETVIISVNSLSVFTKVDDDEILQDISFTFEKGVTQAPEEYSYNGYIYNYETSQSDSYKVDFVCQLDRENGSFNFVCTSGKISNSGTSVDAVGYGFPIPSARMISNNIEIQGYCTDLTLADKLMEMTVSTTFGGSSGLYGNGTRVFLGGCKSDPALMHWSDVNQPLYFSENNYARVGNANAPITAFGKQGEILVIFKPTEMFYTQYVEGSEYTADDVISGKIIDVTTVDAQFPIYQINDTIGCDLPATIQLCLNRLIWATTAGEVYTLVTSYNSSERNVYSVSRNIKRMIEGADMTNAFACDWQEHYILFCKDDVFLLDYNRNSYKYVSNYTKSSGSTTKSFSWWRWKVSGLDASIVNSSGSVHSQTIDRFSAAFFDDKNIVLYGIGDPIEDFNGNGKTFSPNYIFSFDLDEMESCYSMLKTKMFDMSYPQRHKNIDRVYIVFGNEYQSKIFPVYLTDSGAVEDKPMQIITDSSIYGNAHGEIKTLNPHQKRARTFGVKLWSDGAFRLDSMSFEYTVIGGIK